MKTFKILLFLGCLTLAAPQANAQFFKKLTKKLEKKLERKAEEKVDRESDKAIDGVLDPKEKRRRKRKSKKEKSAKKRDNYGNATITHTNDFGTLAINKVGRSTMTIDDNTVRIAGSWRTHEADIFDGYGIVIKDQEILNAVSDDGDFRASLSIPSQADLQLGYDPLNPIKLNPDDRSAAAVGKQYQNYSLQSGNVNITISNGNLQLSFSGKGAAGNVSASAQISDISLYDNRSDNDDNESQEAAEDFDISGILGGALGGGNNVDLPVQYTFNISTTVVIRGTDTKETYEINYLHNEAKGYSGMEMDMSKMSDEAGAGMSYMVLDGEQAHMFVETSGMKMRMSPNMGGAFAQQPSPEDQMKNFDLTKLKKTGATKTILGYVCEEWTYQR